MPERFLVQILRALVTHGVLQSTCGVAGGYSLSRSPEQITLRDIVEAFDNPLECNVPALDCMRPQVRSRIVETLHEIAGAARGATKTDGGRTHAGHQLIRRYLRSIVADRRRPYIDWIKWIRTPGR